MNKLLLIIFWTILIPFYELLVCETEKIHYNVFFLLSLILLFPACAIAYLVFYNKLNWSMAKQWGVLSILFLSFPVVLVIIRCFLGIPNLDFQPESEAGINYFFEIINYLLCILIYKSTILETLTMWAFSQPLLCLALFLFLHLIRKILLFSRFARKIPLRSVEPESIFQTMGWILLGTLPFVWLIIIAEILERFD